MARGSGRRGSPEIRLAVTSRAGMARGGFFGDLFKKLGSTVLGAIPGGGIAKTAFGLGRTLLSGGTGGGCPPGFSPGPGGGCTPDRLSVAGGPGVAVSIPGSPGLTTPAEVSIGGTGEAVMGRFGAAITPMVDQLIRLDCPRGMVLGEDDLCYNRRDLRKDERKWPPGRRPLLTGGDLNAISKAHRAATRFKTQQKRLMDLGMLPRPKTSKRAPTGHHNTPILIAADDIITNKRL